MYDCQGRSLKIAKKERQSVKMLYLWAEIEMYRHSSISVVSISVIFDLTWFIILSYIPPL